MEAPLGLHRVLPGRPILGGCLWGIREGSGSQLQGSWGDLEGRL